MTRTLESLGADVLSRLTQPPLVAGGTLREYVSHKPSCPEFFNVRFKPEPGWVTSSQTKPCNCGLAELLAVERGTAAEKDHP